MKKVITYGTYDLLHRGHIALLERAKALGEYLVVGITSDSFDKSRGKLNVQQSLADRIEAVRELGIADQIVVEEYDGQKISDIMKYNIDIFTVGSDWQGKFDYLHEFCQVVYLERTWGVSSTDIRTSQHPVVRLGLVGLQDPVDRFISEAEFIDGIQITGLYEPSLEKQQQYADVCQLTTTRYIADMNVDAVYISETIEKHYELIKESLMAGFHVICESPMFLTTREAEELYAYADAHQLVLFEALKTAFYPAFDHLILLIQTGIIGEIKDIEVSFSKNKGSFEEISKNIYHGSLYDLLSYVVCPIFKIVGTDYKKCDLYTYQKENFNILTRGVIQYEHAIATFKTGKGIKTEGSLMITGTLGYIYVPAPWWKTEYFELRYEDLRDTKKFFYKCEGTGFRYEILEFLKVINSSLTESNLHTRKEVMATTEILESSVGEKTQFI